MRCLILMVGCNLNISILAQDVIWAWFGIMVSLEFSGKAKRMVGGTRSIRKNDQLLLDGI